MGYLRGCLRVIFHGVLLGDPSRGSFTNKEVLQGGLSLGSFSSLGSKHMDSQPTPGAYLSILVAVPPILGCIYLAISKLARQCCQHHG